MSENAARQCALCGSEDGLELIAVLPSRVDNEFTACGTCRDQITGTTDLDAKHWFCLQESIWSEMAAVQVQGWRLLQRMSGESWAQNLLEQVYLDDELLTWAKDVLEVSAVAPSVDCNGTPLSAGDSITVIKDLDVKGTSFVAKRGTLVKGIRMTNDPELIEGRVNKVTIVIKTIFVKKA